MWSEILYRKVDCPLEVKTFGGEKNIQKSHLHKSYVMVSRL